jgi:hypothetical protein
MAKKYSFITHWEFKAPLPDVWDAIYNSLEWPNWWKGVYKVTEIKKNDANGINGIRAYTWKSALPYELTFTMRLAECEPMKRMKGVAFGELEGTGEWVLSEESKIVKVYYYWNVVTTKKWMNTFAFLLKPLFAINHNVVMHWGAKGLAKKLNCILIKG